MKILKDNIFYIEDFLFQDTCDLLVSTFSDESLKKGKDTGILGGPGRGENELFNVSGVTKIDTLTNNKDKNIGIDIFTGILTNIEKTTSDIFNKNLVLKSYFYSHMKKGGKNNLHIDNHSEKYLKDYSAILYLTDSYSGGSLNFPEQDLNLKPKPGTLITFIGTEKLKHEVQEVIDGDRVNIICFLIEKEKDI